MEKDGMEKMTLKTARVSKDMTQEEMAEALGVSTLTYSLWEKNPKKMRIEKLILFSKVVGRPLDGLDVGV